MKPLLFWMLIGLLPVGETALAAGPAPIHAQSPMSDARFWSLIDGTVRPDADPDAQASALYEVLDALSADEVLGFHDAFERQMTRAYSWDLWAVASIAHGSASDDGFDYFRRWLISRGQQTFEHVLANPDSLADVPGVDGGGVLEFEMLGYVAMEVWAEKSGRPVEDMPIPASWTPPGADPAGEPFEEDPAWLAARFPKTWARFGENPLS
ncbi:MAG: DUF4240 domain-containing protein [Brevundimonas sp.]|nr:DUF4240 domain-containing protein [Brevundimonas sp.]